MWGFEWCSVTTINWHTEIKWNCENVTINWDSISISNDNGNKEKKKKFNIEWNQSTDLKSISDNIKISENVDKGIKTSSISWDISIWWDNNWKISSTSWDIELSKENKWNIKSVSWDIELKQENQGKIKTTSWGVHVLDNNNWDISTISGDITILWENTKNIHTSSWLIKIWDNLSIQLIRNWVFWWNNISQITNGISIWSTNSIIINWEVIVNWKKINGSEGNETKLIINWIKINVEKQEILFENKKISIDKLKAKWYNISDDYKIIEYKWQKIEISDSWLDVTYLSENNNTENNTKNNNTDTTPIEEKDIKKFIMDFFK